MTVTVPIGQVGISDFLIVRLRSTDDSLTEITRQVLGPAPPTNNNIVFTGLDPTTYYFDIYESTDGSALTTLFDTYLINAANNALLKEYRYYIVGRAGANPVAGTNVLDDPYLDGKTIASVSQRGFDKLRDSNDLNPEWARTPTGITIASPLLFAADDTWTLELVYSVPATSPPNSNPFKTEKTITADTTLDSTYNNTLINCNGAGSRLVITLSAVATPPDGTLFCFIDEEGGLQLQTKIKTQIGEVIKWNGLNMSEIWLGKGEHLWLKKKGTSYKVVIPHGGLNLVGHRFSDTLEFFPNTLPEDGTLFSADDYPRLWWWITTKMSGGSLIIDDTLDAGGYTRPVNKEGLFIVSTTKRKFRMPDTRGISEKGLKDFHTYNTDANRNYDFPGGRQDDKVGPIVGATIQGVIVRVATATFGTAGITVLGIPPGSGVTLWGPDDRPLMINGVAVENRVRNIGVIYSRCV